MKIEQRMTLVLIGKWVSVLLITSIPAIFLTFLLLPPLSILFSDNIFSGSEEKPLRERKEYLFNAVDDLIIHLEGSDLDLITGESDKLEILLLPEAEEKGASQIYFTQGTSYLELKELQGRGIVKIKLPQKGLKSVTVTQNRGDSILFSPLVQNLSYSGGGGDFSLLSFHGTSLTVGTKGGDQSYLDIHSLAARIKSDKGNIEISEATFSSAEILSQSGDIALDNVHTHKGGADSLEGKVLFYDSETMRIER